MIHVYCNKRKIYKSFINIDFADSIKKNAGLCPICGDEYIIVLDENILPLIVEFNKKNYRTKFSCSGHEGAYDGARDTDGYIMFEPFDITDIIGYDVSISNTGIEEMIVRDSIGKNLQYFKYNTPIKVPEFVPETDFNVNSFISILKRINEFDGTTFTKHIEYDSVNCEPLNFKWTIFNINTYCRGGKNNEKFFISPQICWDIVYPDSILSNEEIYLYLEDRSRIFGIMVHAINNYIIPISLRNSINEECLDKMRYHLSGI